MVNEKERECCLHRSGDGRRCRGTQPSTRHSPSAPSRPTTTSTSADNRVTRATHCESWRRRMPTGSRTETTSRR